MTALETLDKYTARDEFGNRIWKEEDVLKAMEAYGAILLQEKKDEKEQHIKKWLEIMDFDEDQD
jgi:hypothetical protein